MKRTPLGLVLLLGFLLGACGSDAAGGGANSLGGTAERNYNLDFHYVEIFHQQDLGVVAYTVKYVREEAEGTVQRWPAVVVVTAPLPNTPADLTAAGNRLYRQDEGGDFIVDSGTATFSKPTLSRRASERASAAISSPCTRNVWWGFCVNAAAQSIKPSWSAWPLKPSNTST